MSEACCSTSKGPSNGTQEKTIMTKRKWESLDNWIHCICIVTFDLELGQAVEVKQLLMTVQINKIFNTINFN